MGGSAQFRKNGGAGGGRVTPDLIKNQLNTAWDAYDVYHKHDIKYQDYLLNISDGYPVDGVEYGLGSVTLDNRLEYFRSHSKYLKDYADKFNKLNDNIRKLSSKNPGKVLDPKTSANLLELYYRFWKTTKATESAKMPGDYTENIESIISMTTDIKAVKNMASSFDKNSLSWYTFSNLFLH